MKKRYCIVIDKWDADIKEYVREQVTTYDEPEAQKIIDGIVIDKDTPQARLYMEEIDRGAVINQYELYFKDFSGNDRQD